MTYQEEMFNRLHKYYEEQETEFVSKYEQMLRKYSGTRMVTINCKGSYTPKVNEDGQYVLDAHGNIVYDVPVSMEVHMNNRE